MGEVVPNQSERALPLLLPARVPVSVMLAINYIAAAVLRPPDVMSYDGARMNGLDPFSPGVREDDFVAALRWIIDSGQVGRPDHDPVYRYFVGQTNMFSACGFARSARVEHPGSRKFAFPVEHVPNSLVLVATFREPPSGGQSQGTGEAAESILWYRVVRIRLSLSPFMEVLSQGQGSPFHE